ncbi:MAG: hypothetical protein JNL70_01660 [Saprospiraceae bacterium]|nr:hypothetical protein [Saprospiraceae bacterium]
MKKYIPLLGSLAVFFLLFSSFILQHQSHAVASEHSTLSDLSIQQLSFWQKAALFFGASASTSWFMHRHYRRHYGEGLGCLGVLGIIILGALVIALLPLILVAALVMLIFGIPFPRWGGRRYDRRDRYDRYRHHHRRRRW